MPPIQGHPLKLYLSAANESIGCLLTQNNSKGHEQAVYYFSRLLNLVETRYTLIENYVDVRRTRGQSWSSFN